MASLTSPETTAKYRFPVEDTTTWYQHLQQHGYVVIAHALAPAQVEQARGKLWSDMERIWPGSFQDYSKMQLPVHGLAPELCQSAGAWDVRGNPRIKQAYDHIWNDTELITSMDCVAVWRPWSKRLNQKKPRTEGLHLDQNPFSKPHLECVQGMVPLYPVTPQVGGLAVVPGSHTKEAKGAIKEKYPRWKQSGDWCPIPKRDVELYDAQVLVEAEAGDLILWDSRTVHGGVVGTGGGGGSKGRKEEVKEEKEEVKEEDQTNGTGVDAREWGTALVRLSVTVSMTQRSRASPSCLDLRKEGYEKGLCFNHTPHEAGTSTGTIQVAHMDASYVPCALSPKQWQLLNGTSDGDT